MHCEHKGKLLDKQSAKSKPLNELSKLVAKHTLAAFGVLMASRAI